MTHLLLAVACSLAIGMIFKHAGRAGLDRVGLLTANYAAAALLAGALIALGARSPAGGFAPGAGLVALGVGTGVLFIGGFFLFSLATDVAGMSVATGVMRVSVVIPFAASWLIWGEAPTLAQGAGLALAGAAFFMIAARGKEREGQTETGRAEATGGKRGGTIRRDAPENGRLVAARPSPEGSPVAVAAEATEAQRRSESDRSGAKAARTFGVLALLFVTGGLVDTCMKTFDETFADETSRALFLLMIFGVAFAVGCAELARRRPPLEGRTLAWGAVLGAVNYGSVEFILRAIRALEGPFVFPANNISIVVGAALLGVWCWGEHLSRLNRAGLAVAALALFLLRP